MSTKEQFLGELRNDLRKYPKRDVDDYIEYLDELITDRIASGEREASVLHGIGTAKMVAASFKQDAAVSRAVKKPTVSNGLKALLAVLSVLSLPLLIPVFAIVLALFVAAAAVFIALIAACIGCALAAALSVADMASTVFRGDAPAYLLLLNIGVALIVIVLLFEILRGVFRLGSFMTHLLIYRLNVRHRRKQPDLSLEEQ